MNSRILRLPTCNGAFGETVAGQFFGVLGLEETGDPHPGGDFFFW